MVRVLVVGDVEGDIEAVSAKISALNRKSGPFACAVLLSPVGDTSRLPPSFSCALPTYFAAQDHGGSDSPRVVAPNLHYVGSAAARRLYGLTVLFCAAGYDDPSSGTSALPPEIDAALRTAGVFGAGFSGIDVLVAQPVPRGVDLVAPARASRSRLVARLALLTRPRYHFTSATTYVALPPFSCPGAVHGTRLLAIAPACKQRAIKGQRWVYAADVQPLELMTPAQRTETAPRSAVRPPYNNADSAAEAAAAHTNETREMRLKRALAAEAAAEGGGTGTQHFWDMSRGRGRGGRNGGDGAKRPRVERDEGDASLQMTRRRSRNQARPARPETPANAACWFCLANNKDSHLVVDVGSHVYLALAKGGITRDHLLIVPVDHVRNSLDSRLETSARAEISRYKQCIRAYFKSLNGSGAYFFERAVFTRGGLHQMHMHIQAVPIRPEAAESVLRTAKDVAKRYGITLEEVGAQDASDAVKDRITGDIGDAEFFWAEMPGGEGFVHMVRNMEENEAGGPRGGKGKGDEVGQGNGESQKDGGTLVTGAGNATVENEMDSGIADHEGREGSDEKGTVSGTAVSEVEEERDRAEEDKEADDEGIENKKDGVEEDDHGDGEREKKVETNGESERRKDTESKKKNTHRTGHPLQFGRAVAANALGRSERVDWKQCVGAHSEETRNAERLRDAIEPFLPEECE